MLKSPNQEQNGDLYPVTTDELHTFISRNGFKGLAIYTDYTEWTNGTIDIKIPRTEKLTKTDTLSILNKALFSISDFEVFVPQFRQDLKTFNLLIEQSLHTPSKKKS